MGMYVTVEPLDGSELERLITALLNATGVVHQLIEATERPPGADGVEVIDLAAERLRACLAFIAEFYGDDELALVTGVLAQATLVAAEDLGLGELYFGGDEPLN